MNRVILTVWAVGVLALSTVPIAAGYAAWWAAPVLIGSVVVPTLLVALGRWIRIGSAWIAVGVGLLAVLAGVALSAPGIEVDPQRGSLGVLAPLVDAIPRLLTAPRPAPAEIGYLVPAAMLTWIVALAVALAVTAPGRARIAPLVGAIVLQGAGALLTAGQGDPLALVAMGSVALLLLGWVAIPVGEAPRGGRTSRPLWAASAVAAVVIGTLALPAAALTTGDRFEPRTLVPAPQLPAHASNPLPDVAFWNLNADEVLFTVTSAAAPAPQRIRLAVLPDFDGAAWTLAGQLRQVGVVDEPDLAPGARQHTVTFRIDPGALGGAWLPSLGRAERVDGTDVLMDTSTGSLVTVAGAPTGPVTVTARVDAPTDGTIARAGVPPASEAARYLRLPSMPSELADASRALTEGTDTRWEQVTALADFVREGRTLDQGAPSGASYGRIVEFLFADEAAGGQVGTTEQFAASFAVLARAVGIPTRLVVGFSTDEAETASATTAITGADARVWTEVYLSRAGWVTVDPSPDSAILTEHAPPAGNGAAPTPTPAQPEPSIDQSQPEEAAQPPATGETGAGSGAAVGATIAALVAAVVATLAGLRLRRRLRFKAAGHEGAWAQVLDAVGLAGRAPAAGATPEDVAVLVAAATANDARRGPGVAEDAVRLAERAQRSAFAPDAPAAARREGSGGWAAAVRVERALRAGSAWWRRLLWHLLPRSGRR